MKDADARALLRALFDAALTAARPASAQREDLIVRSSTAMLQEMLRDPNRGVPPALLRQAQDAYQQADGGTITPALVGAEAALVASIVHEQSMSELQFHVPSWEYAISRPSAFHGNPVTRSGRGEYR